LTFAQSKFDPLAARVAAGDTSAYDDFATAARELLDIQRQFSGSQSGYFDLLNRVTDLTRTTLGAADSGNFATVNRDSPFTTTGAPANDNSTVVSAITDQTSMLMAGINQTNAYLQLMAANSTFSGYDQFNLSGQTYF
jgi:hypothetical protein